MPTKKAKRPEIRARDPLTVKARSAIRCYSRLRAEGRGGNWSSESIIDYALKAERMRRTALYAHLEERGYRWKRGCWIKVAIRMQEKKVQTSPRPTQIKKSDAQGLDELDEVDLIALIQAGQISVAPRKGIR